MSGLVRAVKPRISARALPAAAAQVPAIAARVKRRVALPMYPLHSHRGPSKIQALRRVKSRPSALPGRNAFRFDITDVYIQNVAIKTNHSRATSCRNSFRDRDFG